MLSVQHAYDPKSHTLYLGYGDRQQIERPVTLSGGELAIAAANSAEIYVFSADGRHLRTLDALTGAAHYQLAYDDASRLTSITDRDSHQTTIERNSSGAPTALVGPFGSRTTFSLDSNGFISHVVDPSDESTRLAYTAAGLLTALTDQEGNVSHFDYDALGRLDREELPDGSLRTRSYAGDARSYTVTLKSPLLRTFTYAVEHQNGGALRRILTDAAGARTEELIGADGSRKATLPDGTRLELAWGPDTRWGMQAPVLKQLRQITPGGVTTTIAGERVVALANADDPLSLQTLTERVTIDGRTGVSQYDAATRTLTTTSPSGRTASITLDPQGRVLGEQAAGFARASYGYDARGRLTIADQGEGVDARHTSLEYDDAQGALRMTDSLSRTQELRFDSSGQLSQAILPGDRRVGFGYDGRGNLTAITPPGRPAHSVDYTPVGLPASYQPPRLGDEAQATLQTYDADGQLAALTRPGGQKVNFGYDGAGRPSRVTLARGEITSAYSTSGYLANLGAPGGLKLDYSYDGALLTGETLSGPIAGRVGWSYDNNLRVASQSVGGDSIAFAYDEDDLLIKAGDLALTRDPRRGLVTTATLGSVVSGWEYNAFGQPSSYRAAAGDRELYAVRYSYDKLGRIVQLDETIGGEQHAYGYAYDAAGRLAEVRRDGQLTYSYAYDANGNRLSATTPEGTATGIYDAQDRLTQYADASYTYTANGELLSKTAGGQTTGYQYDELGSLLAVAQPDGTKIEYLVDGRGRRVGRKVNGTLERGWIYQDGLRPAAELDGAGTIVSRFVYAGGRNVPDYMVNGGATYRILTDHLGSPRLVVDAATGRVAQRMDYDAFGNVTQDTNPGFQPFGFAGGLYDRDTGLVRFGARDYDAETGRWTAKDPIGFAGGDTNLYGYVGNDPVNFIDPIGAWGFAIGGQAGIGSGGIWGLGTEVGAGLFIDLDNGDLTPYYSVGYTPLFEDPITTACCIIGGSAGGGVVVSIIADNDAFWGSAYEGGVNHLVAGGSASFSAEHGIYGISGSLGPTIGGDVHLYKTYTGTITSLLDKIFGFLLKRDPMPTGVETRPAPFVRQTIWDDGSVTITDTLTGNRVVVCEEGRQFCANIHGEPHIVTLDGSNYDFQAVGEYIAMKSTMDDFEMQVRYTPWEKSRDVSWARAVALNVAGDRVAVYFGKQPTLRINGQVVQLTGRRVWLPGGGRVEQRGREFTIVWPDGSVVQAIVRNVSLNLIISLPESRRGKLAGLLGNFDGDPKNDLATRDGAPVDLASRSTDEAYRQLYRVYGDSWRITQAESLFDYGPGESTATFTDQTFPDKPVTVADLDEATRKAAEQTCRNANVTEQPYLNDCILDVGLTGDADFAQGAAQIVAAIATPTLPRASAGPVVRSDGGQIAFGQTVIGGLSASTEIISYTLTAQANDTVVASIAPEGKGLFEMILFDPRKQTRAPCNGAGCRAASDGVYTLQVRYHDTGNDAQPPYKYSLFVDRATNPVNVQPVAFGQTRSNALDTLAEIDSYALAAKAGDMVVVSIPSKEQEAIEAYLFDPRQHLLTHCNYVGCLAKADGVYYLQIRSRAAGNVSLPTQYTFFLERANDPLNVRPIAFGQTVTGVLTTSVAIDSYALSADTNSIVAARIVGSANVSFDLFLYDAKTRLLYTFNEVGCLAKTDGVYQLQVRLRSASSEPAPYRYTLFVERANNPVNAQSISFGQTLSGELASAVEIDSYSITARKNDLIAATVKSASDASLELTVFDPRQQLQYMCRGTGCKAPSDGTYILQVRYGNRASGTLPYRYSITVRQR